MQYQPKLKMKEMIFKMKQNYSSFIIEANQYVFVPQKWLAATFVF